MNASIDIRFAFLSLLILALGYLTYLIFEPIATYLLAALLLAFMLYPLHVRLRPHIGEKPSAFVLVLFALAAALTPVLILGYLLIESIDEFTSGLDQVALLQEIEDLILAYTGLEIDVLTIAEQAVERLSETTLAGFTDVVFTTLHLVLGGLLLIFVLYYLIVDGASLIEWLKNVLPLDEAIATELLEEANVITWAVLKSHLLVAIIEGVLMGIGFYMAGIPNAAFWTAIMIVLAILPVIGASTIWAPGVLYLVYFDQLVPAAFLFVYGVIILNIENYIRAILVDRESDLHPAVVLVGVLGGLYVFGVLGLFIGPIVLAIFKAVVNVFGRQYTIEGADPAG